MKEIVHVKEVFMHENDISMHENVKCRPWHDFICMDKKEIFMDENENSMHEVKSSYMKFTITCNVQ